MDKYTIRKLVFILLLASLIATPFGIQEYKSMTTTDPYILMAREIERLPIGGIDVLLVEEGSLPNRVTIITFIPEYESWSERKEITNFKRAIIGVILDYNYSEVLIILGWDFPPPKYRIQGIFLCADSRASNCTWEFVPSVELPPELIKWPGIGEP